ncbi:hypothetical protein ACFFIY_13195 [Bhargavaea ullalensis]|uniref:Lipoprotein n=1 Tax=Bhargavaea ullalensis TaxID=1265685 RepID=A0ABV2G822_9BACL
MKLQRSAWLAPAACLLLLGACSGDRAASPPTEEEGTAETDAGQNASGETDSNEKPDSSVPDSAGKPDDGESTDAGQPDGGEDPAGQRAHLLSEIREKVETASDMEPVLPDVPAAEGKYLGAEVNADADQYKVTYYETDKPYGLNAEELDGLSPAAVSEARIYESPGSAKAEAGYEQEPEGKGNVNLGYGITGFEDAGAGSVFLTWHEGRWSFSMRNQNIDNPGGGDEMAALAKKIVAKLEDRMLPPPEEVGAGKFDMSSDTYKLTWQRGAVLYSVSSGDPLGLIDQVADLSE